MSEPTGTYSFLPWMRLGIANNILQNDQDPSVKLRAAIPVDLTLTATRIDGTTVDNHLSQNIQLYGPGDIIGIDNKAIIKTEPLNWITNFESNYLPYIEFYQEDFPWRYTPAKADSSKDRLRPWISLVCLKENEFTEGKDTQGKPLPYFSLPTGINAKDLFPDASQLWAWAHVHTNKDLSLGAPSFPFNADAVKTIFQQLLDTDPDNAYSRLLCARNLEPNTSYHAFLIPSFESGRLAGLGQTIPAALVATEGAWDDNQTEFPYYYSWYFRTGAVGDFEYLVSLLQPKIADKRVGIRDMDVLHPGSNLPAINIPAALAGVLKLGGALQVPFTTLSAPDQAAVTLYDEWDEHPYPHPFEKAMAQRINLADDYTSETKEVVDVNSAAGILDDGSPDPDPIITSPLYGTWHALVKRLLTEKDGTAVAPAKQENWIHELNLDPRFRVAAGFGTKVIQQGQELYMNAAWEQVGDVLAANNKIRFAELATAVSGQFYSNYLLALPAEKQFLFTAPVQKKILLNGLTIYKQVRNSLVPGATASGPMRRIASDRSPFLKRLKQHPAFQSGQLFSKINTGKVVIVAPKTVPAGSIKLTDALSKFSTTTTTTTTTTTAVTERDTSLPILKGIGEKNQTSIEVDQLPTIGNFNIVGIGEVYKPVPSRADSIEAVHFKTALKDAYAFGSIDFVQPVRAALNMAAINTQAAAALHPSVSIQKRLWSQLKIPDRIKAGMTETFTPVMAYPELDMPMYKPLSDLSAELFLPNINLIAQNSVTLLQNNQRFIESYMVGLNHEMSRELLWREYPTDQRGSYFRQFWDISNFLPVSGQIPDVLREKLRDIYPIHLWPTIPSPQKPLQHKLGKHNPRADNNQPDNIVMVVRGDLLKRYPTAVIYAQLADWGKNANGVADIHEDRVLIDLSDAERQNPGDHPDKIQTPLFQAKVDPDIYFFGFDLTAQQALGDPNPSSTSNKPGWFFVIKERPGEPRFGLDENLSAHIYNWNDLSWQNTGIADGKNIVLNSSIVIETDPAPGTDNKNNKEDAQAQWNPQTNAASLAYILFQAPVLVAVHASKMLPA